MSTSAPLLIEQHDAVLRLTLNRPEKRNALSRELLTLLDQALRDHFPCATLRAVVLGATGSVFCAGHDLGEMTGLSEQEQRELFELCARFMLSLRRLSVPVIARVQGLATAAGCQLVAACDLAVAAEHATFATPGVKIGLFCSTPAVPLVRAIPAKPAFEMLLTGQPISAQRACELGLVNRVVPVAALDETLDGYLQAIHAASPLAIALGKASFYEQLPLDEAQAYQRATETMLHNVACHDAREGIRAFLEKRPPRWQGC